MSINQRSKTAVYVDGFNPYYGAVKGTHYKWLNIRRMCQNMLSDCDLVPIRYFTARVKAAGGNRKAPLATTSISKSSCHAASGHHSLRAVPYERAFY